MKSIEIFIVTYWKDLEWLDWCIKSIQKFATGFDAVNIATPNADREGRVIDSKWFDDVQANGKIPIKVKRYDEIEGKGMLQHMAINCMPDEFGVNSDYCLHMDSDCIFFEPVTPHDYFLEGRPILLKQEYEDFKTLHPGVYYWKECTERALGRPVHFETMRRHPAVHPRHTYIATRSAVERTQKRPFMEWAIDGRNEYPQFWSEFNLLGAIAHEMFPEDYSWVNVGKIAWPPNKICQFWSHGGLDRPKDTEPFMGEIPRKIYERFLG